MERIECDGIGWTDNRGSLWLMSFLGDGFMSIHLYRSVTECVAVLAACDTPQGQHHSVLPIHFVFSPLVFAYCLQVMRLLQVWPHVSMQASTE